MRRRRCWPATRGPAAHGSVGRRTRTAAAAEAARVSDRGIKCKCYTMIYGLAEKEKGAGGVARVERLR